MKSFTFKVGNNTYKFECTYRKTRSGFNHGTTMIYNNSIVAGATAHYINRTWESFEYQSVIEEAVRKYIEFIKNESVFRYKRDHNLYRLTTEQKEDIYARNPKLSELDALLDMVGEHRESSDLRAFGMLAALGELLGSNEKEKNDLKKQAIAAVPGMDIPEDFDSLSEEEKKRRLDAVTNVLLDKPNKE